jgi:DNA-binding CsgD family transcriptional regulator
LLFFLPFLKIEAQYSYLLHKPYKDKVFAIDTLYARIVSIKDTTKAYREIREIGEIGRKNNDRETELESELLEAYYDSYRKIKPNSVVLNGLKKIEEKGKTEKYLHIEARALRVVAEFYWRRTGNYEQAFTNYLRLNDLIETADEKDFPNKAEYFYLIGELYYFFKDYRSAIYYMQKTLAIKETAFNWKAVWAANNTLGLCFQRMNRLPSSDYFFNNALKSKYIKPESIYYTIIQGGLAQNLFSKGEYQKAFPLSVMSFNKATDENDRNLAASEALLISKIYLKLGDKTRFSEWLEKAKFYVSHSERPYERMSELYSLMSSWHVLNGQEILARNYLDSAIIAKDTLNARQNALYLLRATQSEQAQKMRTEQEKRRLTEQKRIFQLYTSGIVIVFLMIIAVLIYRNQKKKRKIEQFESKQKLAAVEEKLSVSEQKLIEAQEHLRNFVANIAEKEKQIKKLSLTADENAEELNQLIRSAILTAEDWEKFKTAFETVYPTFFSKLHKKIPTITAAEIRLLALAKMKMTRKEIAATLGVSINSIHNTWHRIRKKIPAIEKNVTMENFVGAFRNREKQ